MRVIAGTARSLPLKTIEGLETRPTTDRIKETLFNMLQNEIPGSRFLDLFAGSGGIGIEALSRGSEVAHFIEHNRKAGNCINENLQFTKFAEKGKVLVMGVVQGLMHLNGEKPYDIVFMDPPYGLGLELEAFTKLKELNLVHKETILILEESTEFDPSEILACGFRLLKQKKYKTNQHFFFELD